MDDIAWRKSSFSAGQGNCIEVRKHADGSRDIRDSKDPDGPILSFTRDEWRAFSTGVWVGEFD